MELILALILFVGMVAAWIMMPNGEKAPAQNPIAHEEEGLVTA